MNTTENTVSLETVLPIRCTSGGERGKKDSGRKYSYLMPKVTFMALVSTVFDKELENSKEENVASGGAVSQFLHSYGVSAGKIESSGRDPFPKVGEEFTEENAEAWLEILEFKKEREAGARKTAKEHKMDAILLVLNVPGVTWEIVAPGYPDITKAEVEAYKVKLSEVAVSDEATVEDLQALGKALV